MAGVNAMMDTLSRIMETIYACPICGLNVGDRDGPVVQGRKVWRNEFRGLYLSRVGVRVTGVGLYRRKCSYRRYAAPPDYEERWNDDYHINSPELSCSFGVMGESPEPCGFVMGFAFHAACWSLLEAACGGKEGVPLEKLYDVCASLPVYREFLHWGHDYGGIVNLPGRVNDGQGGGGDDERRYPWEVRAIRRKGPDEYRLAKHNPRLVAEIHEILAYVPPVPTGPPRLAGLLTPYSPPPAEKTEEKRIGLSSMPREILLCIAEKLPTRDMLRARLATRAFWPAYHAQSFWASRFRGCNERSWMLEAFEGPSKPVQHDWMSLYDVTRRSHVHAVQNRCRVWHLLIKQILPLLNAIPHSLRPVLGTHENANQNPGAGLVWVGAKGDSKCRAPPISATGYNSGNDSGSGSGSGGGGGAQAMLPASLRQFMPPIRCPVFQDPEGCREEYKSHVLFNSAPSSLTFWFVVLGDACYLTGIGVQVKNTAPPTTTSTTEKEEEESMLKMGYETQISLRHEVEPGSGVYGFTLALGPRGIHGIRVHGDGDSVSGWYGCPGAWPRSVKTLFGAPLKGISASFDGFKVVRIGVAKDELAPCPLTYSLRNCAQWYPDVPPADAFVNDDSFPLTQRHKTKYRPLFLSAFGGEKGSLLHKLARVSVTTGDAVYGIQFGYSDGRTADLGGCRVDDLGRYRSGGGGAGDVGNTLTKGFDIDGAGGEIICAVVLFLERPRELWEMQGTAFTRMMGIEFVTNFGQSRMFFAASSHPANFIEMDLIYEAGTTITGLYGTQEDGGGFKALGIMSERLPGRSYDDEDDFDDAYYYYYEDGQGDDGVAYGDEEDGAVADAATPQGEKEESLIGIAV